MLMHQGLSINIVSKKNYLLREGFNKNIKNYGIFIETFPNIING